MSQERNDVDWRSSPPIGRFVLVGLWGRPSTLPTIPRKMRVQYLGAICHAHPGVLVDARSTFVIRSSPAPCLSPPGLAPVS
jgi:hypothetical protein